MHKRIRYWIPDQGETQDQDSREIEVPCDDMARCAEYAAEDFHDKHDGWDRSWPVEIGVSIGGESGVFTMTRESVHVFRARPCPA